MPYDLENRRTALYRLYNALDQLLYIGITHNPTVRWTQHAALKPWWPKAARKNIEWFDCRSAAAAAEVAAIVGEHPLHNIRHVHGLTSTGPRGAADLIASILRCAILDGEYQPGDRLPSIAQLSVDRQVHRDTVQRAFTQLRREQLIRVSRRSGTFVMEQKSTFTVANPDLYRRETGYYFDRSTETWTSIGATTQRLAATPPDIAELLGIPAGHAALIRQYSAGLADTLDVRQFVTHYVPLGLVAALPVIADVAQLHWLYDLLEAARQAPVDIVEQIYARTATKPECQALDLPEHALVLVRSRRVTQPQANGPETVEIVESVMSATRASISYDVQRHASTLPAFRGR
ncbi:GntR family transcriptional regulator [Kitasatospora sp. NPDC052868]|uniref:GntR family transcriptional regulator n=1 Tax=Kitasatospora sp. NPDC052868 TaxID=3364060 RepID=UPI0037CA2CE8